MPPSSRQSSRTVVSRLHGGLRQADLRLRQAKGPAALAAPGACRLQARHRAFPDQLPLEFRQGRKNPEDQLAADRRGVDAGALARQDFQPDAALCEFLGGIDQMLQVASQAVELPVDERIAVPQRLETGGESQAILVCAGGLVFVEGVGTDTSSEERIALQVQHLTAVRFGDAGIAEQHGVVSQTLICERQAVPHLYAWLAPRFSLSEHSLETPALMCYRCAEF